MRSQDGRPRASKFQEYLRVYTVLESCDGTTLSSSAAREWRHVVKLRDGSEHRCSRTYSGALDNSVDSERNDGKRLAEALRESSGIISR
jgi:hypothetical protein